jgi:hypothetical protein
MRLGFAGAGGKFTASRVDAANVRARRRLGERGTGGQAGFDIGATTEAALARPCETHCVCSVGGTRMGGRDLTAYDDLVAKRDSDPGVLLGDRG